MTFVTAGPLRLWTERTGDPDRPAVLLLMGASAQSLTCPDALIERLVGRGVQVIRYDSRDTGRSSLVDYDRSPYGLAGLAADALAVLDAYGLDTAHIAGFSMGGMVAQWLGVHAPARVRSLTLITSTPMDYDPGPLWRGEPSPTPLPPPAPAFLRYLDETADSPPGVETDVALFRVMNGDKRPLDEAATRAMLERCWARVVDPEAAGHHQRAGTWLTPDRLVPLSTITAPARIVSGDADPIYAPAHGEALAAAIPQADLHVVPGMGHVCFSPGLPEELADLILVKP
ncbi:hydrolase [Paractinoplanes abujensis]|uniref:Pimeloyl-ACP methyl ester carboxylesterase n=1 Tax=Paractinoplanes abujensis TaxID=882441 RepID=A0A7W7CS65_9ACTN|nr:alpha/beta hydrolase [Actinoplanes abujensis]MBB4692298.1 pimeloyl-ACP methyl ester carboxylesterase [Actinoplanes abujensis]GID24224.1 hydrolase [Actinoplanes abujensis]